MGAQERVQAILDELTGSGEESGLQVAAYVGDERVVDAWSGVADTATGRTMDGDAIMTVFSVTKGIVATAFHRLAARRLIDYDAPVTRYWPEFGQAGKERATVRQALSHTVGVPRMPEGVKPEELGDWEGICARIAAAPPEWEPGTKTGYHAYTWGWIVGEIMRRAGGRPVGQIVREEIAEPLGVQNSLYLGLPDDASARVAPLQDGGWLASQQALPAEALLLGAIPLAVTPSPAVHNRPDVQRAVIPAGGGMMSARAIARHYAALANGSVDGVQLLTPDKVREVTAVQTQEMDLALGAPLRKGLGYFLGGPLSPMGGRMTAFGHPGVGGAIGFADPEYRFAFGLAKTRLTVSGPGEGTASRVARATREELGIPEDEG